MAPKPAGREAGSGAGLQRYKRHRPEHTLLYKLVEKHYPVFAQQMAARGTPLPRYVHLEFEDYLACGRLEHGFLRVRCDTCHAEQLVAFVVGEGVSARVAAPGGWPNAPRCWSMRLCLMSPSGSGF